MPSANEFSTTPDNNATIGGFDVSEGCPPANMNNALRYVAAVIRDTSDKIPTAGAAMQISGGTFTGDILRKDRGAYLHHAGQAQQNGQVSFLPDGSARPAAVEGAVAFYY